MSATDERVLSLVKAWCPPPCLRSQALRTEVC
jgi:hypothetical protein